MRPYYKYLLLFLLVLTAAPAVSQSNEFIAIRQGNKLYQKKQFKQAELHYKRALSYNPRSARGFYNMGNALLMQNEADKAMQMYAKAAAYERNPKIRARIFHNMGFVEQKKQNYDQAIAYYKKALRNDPTNDDTRYNLALCQHMKKSGKGGQQNKKQQQQKQKQQGQNKEQKQQQPKQQPKQQQGKQDQLSKQNAENLLNIVEREERNTQDKLQKKNRQPQTKQLEKNW